MWSLDTPENRLRVAKTYGNERRAEAAADRNTSSADCVDGVLSDGRRFTGRRLHLGSRLIVFGRTLHEEEAHCAEGARS
jgi:hypothetical protein